MKNDNKKIIYDILCYMKEKLEKNGETIKKTFDFNFKDGNDLQNFKSMYKIYDNKQINSVLNYCIANNYIRYFEYSNGLQYQGTKEGEKKFCKIHLTNEGTEYINTINNKTFSINFKKFISKNLENIIVSFLTFLLMSTIGDFLVKYIKNKYLN